MFATRVGGVTVARQAIADQQTGLLWDLAKKMTALKTQEPRRKGDPGGRKGKRLKEAAGHLAEEPVPIKSSVKTRVLRATESDEQPQKNYKNVFKAR